MKFSCDYKPSNIVQVTVSHHHGQKRMSADDFHECHAAYGQQSWVAVLDTKALSTAYSV